VHLLILLGLVLRRGVAVTRFAGGMIGLSISLVLFAGFNVVNLLSSNDAAQYVGAPTVDFFKAQKLWLYSALALLFTVQQVWLRWPRPASLVDVEEIRGIVHLLLQATLDEYYGIVASKSTQPAPSVRAHIMLPTWRRFRCGQYIKIYHIPSLFVVTP
jgi:hypothetical protein